MTVHILRREFKSIRYIPICTGEKTEMSTDSVIRHSKFLCVFSFFFFFQMFFRKAANDCHKVIKSLMKHGKFLFCLGLRAVRVVKNAF